MNRILITPRALTRDGDPSLTRLREAGYELVFCAPGATPSEPELLELVPGCVGWLAGVEPVSERVLQAATSLRAISRNGTGVNNLPLDAARRAGIQVLRAEAANARGVAELAIGLTLSALRHLPETCAALKEGRWHRRDGLEIEGRWVVVIGCGAVGRLVVRLALGLGARTAAFDPFGDPSFAPGPDFTWLTSLEAAYAQADVLSLHCPPPPGGQPLLDRAALGQLKPDACLINTARAGLVDESALLEALDGGKLRAYATDVFTTEPPAPSPLLAHPRVIATPHLGGFTQESVGRAARAAVDNLLRALGG